MMIAPIAAQWQALPAERLLLIGIAAKLWIRRKVVTLSDVQAEGDPKREGRSRFLLGIWRHEGRE